MTTGKIIAIYTAPMSGADQVCRESARVEPGKGIEGDRHFGIAHSYEGQSIAFIESEVIDAFQAEFRVTIAQYETRRNVITQGIRLNDLLGKTFRIGDAVFVGRDLCEPCKTLGERLSRTGVAAKHIVKYFVHRGGLLADVISPGEIRPGDVFEVFAERSS